MRGYNQGAHNPDAEVVVTLPDARWANYYSDLAGGKISAEIPPFPPGPYNDTGATDPLHDSGSFTHHLIRDFMFLDAAVNNNITLVSSLAPAWPAEDFPFHVVRRALDTSEGNVALYTNGTGADGTLHHSGTFYVLDDSSGTHDDGSLIQFESRDIGGFTALLYELQDTSGATATEIPNWFGVAVPDGITDFRNVIIYFHPNPAQSGAAYDPRDYQDKSGAHSTNWKELFAYVERLGKQLAGAVKYSTDFNDLRNQIVIFPFFRDYDDVGIFPTYWSFIVKSILDDLYANRSTFSAP